LAAKRGIGLILIALGKTEQAQRKLTEYLILKPDDSYIQEEVIRIKDIHEK